MLVLDPKFHKGTSMSQKKVKPSQIDKTSVLSENMIQLIFYAKTLQKGASYKLELDKRITINQELTDLEALTIKTSTTQCNPKGSLPAKGLEKGCK